MPMLRNNLCIALGLAAVLALAAPARAADQGVSTLPAAGALGDADLLYGVQGGNSRKITGLQLYNYIAAKPVLCAPLPAFTGDVTNSGCGMTLAASGVSANTYGSATQVPQITVDAKGRITVAGNVTITPAFSSLTGSLACSQAPALTGDVTTSAGSCGTAYNNKVPLSKGGTNTDLSATGGTHQFVKQSGAGANLTVGQPACADLSDASAFCNGASAANLTGLLPVSSQQETVNAQTGTSYTVADADRGKLITFSNAAAIAVTLPQAGASSSFLAGWFADTDNIGAGTVTITPTTSTIDGAASVTLATNAGMRIVSDGTNYFTVRGKSTGGGSGTVTSVTCGTGLTGGTFTTSGTCALSTPVSATNGGSGVSNPTAHAVLLGEGSSAFGTASIGTAGRLLIDQGAAADPVFVAAGGDCTVNSSGIFVCTKTNNVAFAAVATSGSASDLSAGTLACAREPALTGDITTSAGACGTTIAAAAVTLAKMANLAANSFIGNNTGSPATPLALTVAQARVLIGDDQRTPVADLAYSMVAGDYLIVYTSITAARNVTLLAASTLNPGRRLTIIDGSGSVSATLTISLVPNGTDTIDGSNTTQVVINQAYGGVAIETDGSSKWFVRKLALSGDVTASGFIGNALATTIAASAVTYAKMQNVAASRVLGNPTGSPAAPSEISLGATLTFSGAALQTAAGTGDCTWSANAFVTNCTKTNGVAFAPIATSGSASDLSAGTIPAARLPNPTASTPGGVESLACPSHQWLNTISTGGVPSCGQPNVTDIVNAASLTAADQTLSGGANVTAANLGTKSSGTTTIDCGTVPLQYLTNAGAFTLAAPANDGSCIVLVVNNSGFATPTFSGFLVGSNTGDAFPSADKGSATCTITIASPGVVTYTAHGLPNNAPVYLTTTGSLPTGLSVATIYYTGSVATNTFQLSATPGGSAINTSGSQSGTHTCHEAAQASIHIWRVNGMASYQIAAHQ